MTLRIGVDTGGTFTDMCAVDEETGRVHVRKVSSTPDDPGRAIVVGMAELLAQIGDRRMDEVALFAHGTTVGTNALLTGNGARTGLITTRGFRDLLELGRGRRPHMYDPQADKPEPLVPRHLRIEVDERVRHTGAIETPLDEAQVRAAAAALREAGVESVAVCLLYSYLVPDHERRIGEILAEELPDAYVSLSSEVLPEFREFERLSTVVTNAWVGPVVQRYLERLRATLAEAGMRAAPQVTQSNGGVIPFRTAERMPVRLLLSGPSTGVVGAARICTAAGYPDVITFDMGGTSSDVSLVQGGEPQVATGSEIDGRFIRSPMLDIHTVGAGGGSIGWIDSGHHLRVGPQSAGAVPGPACYGVGTEPTVTDANVVLGTLNPRSLLDGRLPLDREAAVDAVRRVGERIDLGVEETALGMLRVVTANMARAIRVVSVQRGYDPRDYALVPFGGAGPLHASRLARELGMRTIIVPPVPGAQSALGLLMTEMKTDFTRSQVVPLEAGAEAAVAAILRALDADAAAWFEEEGIAVADRRIVHRVEVRYAGQNFELSVPMPEGLDIEREGVGRIVDDFHAAHEHTYGYRAEELPVQAVVFRAQALGPAGSVGERSAPVHAGDAIGGVRRRDVVLDASGPVAVVVHDRARLEVGAEIAGPAIIEQMDTTTVLLPGDRCRVDPAGNLVIDVGGAE